MILPLGDHYAPSTSFVNALLTVWHPSRQFAWTWKIASSTLLPNHRVELIFDESCGGNQASIGGSTGSGTLYIENTIDALDEAGEYFYQDTSNELYVSFNDTRGNPSGKESWGLVQTQELVRFAGTQKNPVRNVQIQGIEFRDTAATWLDPHSEPVGSDWTLPKKAAIVLKGVDDVRIQECLFERLDGNAILLEGFTRNVAIEKNEFAWLGASAIVSIGKNSNCLNAKCTTKLDEFAFGPDGRAGNQPRGTVVAGNLFRELGVFVKQSSAYFSALSGNSVIQGNVMFNSPRNFVTFNDGFLGGDEIRMNLMLNAMRESSHSGPIAAWDRIPFFWEGEHGAATVQAKPRSVEQNLIIANFAARCAVDMDEGSSTWKVAKNALVYGGFGSRSVTGGHSNEFIGNLHLFIESQCFSPSPGESSVLGDLVYRENVCITADETGYGSKCGVGREGGVVAVSRNRVASLHGDLRVCGGRLLKEDLQSYPHRDPETKQIDIPSNEHLASLIESILP